MLDRLTAALTEHLCPEACVVVAKAADQALDLYQLGMSLATHVPVAKCAAFIDGIGEMLRVGQPGALTPALRTLAARRLAEHIGPVARVLVERESRGAASPADLYARLAQHIREPRARQVFMAGSPR